jgi:serine/threonine-protein kinase
MVIAPLGEGGMGMCSGHATQLLREVAETLPFSLPTIPTARRFQREAQVLAALNHANIAQIYGFQQTGNSGAIVMELVDGEHC